MASLIADLAVGVGKSLGTLRVTNLLTSLCLFCGQFCMGLTNMVGKSLGMIFLIGLLIRPCRTGCLFCYLISQRGAADDGFDNVVGSRSRHRTFIIVDAPLGDGLLNGSMAASVYL